MLPFNLEALDCEDSCTVTKSCEEYVECKVAKLECIAACKQIEVSEKFLITLDKITETFEKLIDRLTEEKQENTASAEQP
tara:strand:+ start:921 stop:1160 length:240 start_codon:yes stop_codon:yes gene_type:complete